MGKKADRLKRMAQAAEATEQIQWGIQAEFQERECWRANCSFNGPTIVIYGLVGEEDDPDLEHLGGDAARFVVDAINAHADDIRAHAQHKACRAFDVASKNEKE